MTAIIVADTGPLIALSTLELLSELSPLFETVYAPNAVIKEALYSRDKPGAIGIAEALDKEWIRSVAVPTTPTLKKLAVLLDAGESEALSLAKELGAIALIDERKGRRIAKAHNIPVTGTIAVLIAMKKSGLISSIKPLLNRLATRGYRLNPKLIDKVLIACNENE